jgi:hypothetical protein
MSVELPAIEPGDHIGVSGSRHAPTRDAVNALRFMVDQCAALGATSLHQGCCTGWDEASVEIARKAGLKVIGHPPTVATWRSQWAIEQSDVLWAMKPYNARNMDIAFETILLITGPQYPEDDSRSAHSGTWLTTGHARRYDSRIYACIPDGRILDVTERTESR